METDKDNGLHKEFDEVKTSKQTLQKTITELSGKLYEVNEKLKDSESLKSHFISNITNEIVNPFTSIIGLSNSILKLGTDEMGKAKKIAGMIYSEAFSLNFQLKNIFAAAKLEAGETFPEISYVDIEMLIKEVIEDFKFETEKKNIEVIADICWVNTFVKKDDFKSDPEKLKIILLNLLSNSIKYSTDNSEIKVNVNIKKDTLIISVSDTGKGINETDRQIIFNRFKQLDSNINSINKGYGLGLSVTKALIDILDGSIEIISKENEGSKFIIKVPGQMENNSDIPLGNDDVLLDNDGIF